MNCEKNIPSIIFFFLVGILALIGPTSLWAGPTLTAGGDILVAADTTTAAGGSWRVYDKNSSVLQATGSIDGSGYWYGEVGHFLDNLAVGSELVAIIEVETGSGVDSKGYYATISHPLTGADPAYFDTITLRQIPEPAPAVAATGYRLSWQPAIEDGNGSNIIGYNIFRSTDGLNYTQINTELLTVTNYIDTTPLSGAAYYAVGLVYVGTPQFSSQFLSGATTVDNITDSDGDGIADEWELYYFTLLEDADNTTDHDQDGYNDAQEYQNWLNSELDLNSNGYDPLVQNTAGGTGYSRSSNILMLTLPAILNAK